MYPWFTNSTKKSVNIDSLYDYAKTNQQTLFPTEDFDFWVPYELNYQKFDRFFYQKFRAFKVCQDYAADASMGDMLTDWKQIVDAHLFINAKRYSELYRVQVLDADAYDIVNNYDLRETIERINTGTVTDNIGNRVDQMTTGGQTHDTVYGAQSEQTAFGATNRQEVHGAQTETTQVGAAQNSTVYGSKTNSNQTNLGQQTSTSTQTRSAFNTAGLSAVTGGDINNGARQDSATLTEGSHTDTESLGAHSDTVSRGAFTDTTTEAARTDTHSATAHTDTLTDSARQDSHTQGAQENVRTDDLEEQTTIRRSGNIGVQTPADVVGGHIDLWQAFRFYQMIFDEIAAEYLVIDVEFDFYNAGSTSGGGGGGGDAELLAAIRALSAQLTAAQTSINNNVDDAETHIRSDVSALSAKTTTDTATVVAAVTMQGGLIRDNVSALSSKTTSDTAAIRGDISALSSKTTADTATVVAAVTMQGGLIRDDILDVTTQGY